MTALGVTLGESTLASPVMVASGCGGSGRELESFLDLPGLGAFVTRSVTLDPRTGDATPRVVETPSGLLADASPRGAGLEGFLATELPWLAQHEVRTFVSVAGGTLGELAELTRRTAAAPGVAGIEVNLAWPAGSRASHDPFHARRAVATVRSELPRGVALLAKVAADPVTVVDTAGAAAEAGAHAVVVGHGQPGLAVDPHTLRPALRGAGGSLGGPAVHAVAVRCLWDTHAALPDVTLVGCGGVRSGADALGMLAAGATAVQVGTALLHDPTTPVRVAEELRAALAERGVDAVDVIACAHATEGEPR